VSPAAREPGRASARCDPSDNGQVISFSSPQPPGTLAPPARARGGPRTAGRLAPFWLLAAILRAPFARQTWAGLLYIVVGLPFAALATVLAAPLVVGAPLTITLIGMPLVVITLLNARRLAGLQRDLAGALIGEQVDAPRPVRRGPGLWGWLDAGLRDAAGWRAVGYFAIKLPLAVAGSYTVLALPVFGVTDLVYPLRWASGNPAARSFREHHSVPFTFFPVRTQGGAFVIMAFGLGALLLLPWAVRLLVAIDRRLIRGLLGPVTLSERVRSLQASRARAVDESAAELRRIERDLHDGAQARLAALAMTLGQIKENLASEAPGASPHLSRTRELADAAHRNAKDALAELRDLARGIHPPVLDAGLGAALATLVTTSAIPVRVAVDLPDRPSPSIETMAYFCVAELLANVAKHSGAARASVQVAMGHGRLLVTVTDDGNGGARVGAGGGLAGLVERVGTVDGEVLVESPAGGPTVVSIELPRHS
jgi:signal transduction histidine kinase